MLCTIVLKAFLNSLTLSLSLRICLVQSYSPVLRSDGNGQPNSSASLTFLSPNAFALAVCFCASTRFQAVVIKLNNLTYTESENRTLYSYKHKYMFVGIGIYIECKDSRMSIYRLQIWKYIVGSVAWAIVDSCYLHIQTGFQFPYQQLLLASWWFVSSPALFLFVEKFFYNLCVL